jgi:hypothetical protein
MAPNSPISSEIIEEEIHDAQSGSPTPADARGENLNESATPLQTENTVRISTTPAATPYEGKGKTIHVLTLLGYIRSTFDDESVLDSLPLDAAGNPGAWHAWKAHRRTAKGAGFGTPDKRGAPQARLPGEWNWQGVWAKRVQGGIQASQSDAVLFANASRMETDSVSETL